MQTVGSLSFVLWQFALIAKGALLAHTLNIFHKQDVYKEVQAEIKPRFTYVAKVLSCLWNFLIKQVDCKFPFYVTKLNILCLSKLQSKGKAVSRNAFHVTKTLDPYKEQGQGNAWVNSIYVHCTKYEWRTMLYATLQNPLLEYFSLMVATGVAQMQNNRKNTRNVVLPTSWKEPTCDRSRNI